MSRDLIAPAILAGAVTILTLPTTYAQVSQYGLDESVVYEQTSDAQPTATAGYLATWYVNSSPGAATSATVTGAGSSLSLGAGLYGFSAVQSYSSLGALTAAIPNNTTYTFTLAGGTYNGQTAALNSISSSALTTVPYFTGTTFAALQDANASQPINVSFNAWTGPTGVSSGTGVSIYSSSGASVFTAFPLADSSTSLAIPAGTLLPGQTYTLNLAEAIASLASGFSPAVTGIAAEQVVTEISLTTAKSSAAAPEIDRGSAASALMLLLGCLAVWRANSRGALV